MKVFQCLPTDEVFTHLADDGEVRHFNASAMFRAALPLMEQGKVTLINVEMDYEFVRFVIDRRGVEPEKLARLREPYLSQPVIGVDMDDGFVLMVDGHHRLVRLANRGDDTYSMLRFARDAWEAFLVEDMPQSLCARLEKETYTEQGKVSDDFLKSIS